MSEATHLVIERHHDGEPMWWAVLHVQPHWCDWRLVRSGQTWDETGKLIHYGESCFSDDARPTVDTAQPTLYGFIKWDGCMEFSAGDEDGHIHVCNGAESAREVFEAWMWLLGEAHKAMMEAGAKELLWEPLDGASERT